jgi:hypothetical protein
LLARLYSALVEFSTRRQKRSGWSPVNGPVRKLAHGFFKKLEPSDQESLRPGRVSEGVVSGSERELLLEIARLLMQLAGMPAEDGRRLAMLIVRVESER